MRKLINKLLLINGIDYIIYGGEDYNINIHLCDNPPPISEFVKTVLDDEKTVLLWKVSHLRWTLTYKSSKGKETKYNVIINPKI